jgi:hypothetical protein
MFIVATFFFWTYHHTWINYLSGCPLFWGHMDDCFCCFHFHLSFLENEDTFLFQLPHVALVENNIFFWVGA